MLDLERNDDGTWNITGVEAAHMAEIFVLVDDEVRRFRRLHSCRTEGEHRRHACLVLLHSAIMAARIPHGRELSTARGRATVAA